MICSPPRPKRCAACLPINRRADVIGPVAVLRPEPGNQATIARLSAAGVAAVALPLFAVQAIDWQVPDPASFDALVLTSANAVRWAGEGLAALRQLSVHAVGEATAAAARAAGFDVMVTGNGDAQEVLASMRQAGVGRALHLGGRESMVTPGIGVGAIVGQSICVYASNPVPVPPRALAALADGVALLHSPRAAVRFGALIDTAGFARGRITLASLSPAIAAAAGAGWRAIRTAPVPTDEALVKLVAESLHAG